MHKALCRFITKTMCTHKDRSVRFIKLNIRSVLQISFIMELGTHARASFPLEQFTRNGCRNALFEFRYLCPLHLSIDLFMTRMAKKKCNLTFCVALARFSQQHRNSCQDCYSRLSLSIVFIPLTHHMYM